MKVQVFSSSNNATLTYQINEWINRVKPKIIDKQVSTGGAGHSEECFVVCYIVIWYK